MRTRVGLIVLLCGCIGNTLDTQTFLGEGFSFTCPQGWSIREQTINGTRIVFCEKVTGNFGGGYSFSVEKHQIEANLSRALSESANMPEFVETDFGNMTSTPFRPSRFNGIDAVVSETIAIQNGPTPTEAIKTQVIGFNCDHQGFVVLLSAPKEYFDDNFEVIKSSFTCD
jgi:hypothetical protein